MDTIWDRKSFEVGGHGPKNRMTTQNRQKSNAKKFLCTNCVDCISFIIPDGCLVIIYFIRSITIIVLIVSVYNNATVVSTLTALEHNGYC